MSDSRFGATKDLGKGVRQQQGRGGNVDCLALCRIAGGGMTCIHTHSLTRNALLHYTYVQFAHSLTNARRACGYAALGKPTTATPLLSDVILFDFFSSLSPPLHAMRIGRAWRAKMQQGIFYVRNVDLGSAPAAVTLLHAPTLLDQPLPTPFPSPQALRSPARPPE